MLPLSGVRSVEICSVWLDAVPLVLANSMLTVTLVVMSSIIVAIIRHDFADALPKCALSL